MHAFASYHFFSSKSIIVIAVVLLIISFVLKKSGPINNQTMGAWACLIGVFFVVKEFFPLKLTIAIMFYLVARPIISQRRAPRWLKGMELAALAVVALGCGWYFEPEIILQLSIMIGVLVAFLLLI